MPNSLHCLNVASSFPFIAATNSPGVAVILGAISIKLPLLKRDFVHYFSRYITDKVTTA